MTKLFNAILGAIALLAAGPAAAGEIAYGISGNASGTLNGEGFSGPTVITSVANLATLQPCLDGGVVVPGCQFVVNDRLIIANEAFGAVDVAWTTISFFNDPIDIFGFSLVGFFQQPPVYTFAFVNIGNVTPDFAQWNGFSDFGPVATNWGINGGPPGIFLPTTGGALRFTTQRPLPATFAALTATAAVPEPSTWLMMILGFGLAGGALRRRKAAGALAAA